MVFRECLILFHKNMNTMEHRTLQHNGNQFYFCFLLKCSKNMSILFILYCTVSLSNKGPLVFEISSFGFVSYFFHIM